METWVEAGEREESDKMKYIKLALFGFIEPL